MLKPCRQKKPVGSRICTNSLLNQDFLFTNCILTLTNIIPGRLYKEYVRVYMRKPTTHSCNGSTRCIPKVPIM